MHLTLQTDYALRVLLYLAARPGETISVQTISAAYGVSSHHLAKVAKQLVRDGLVEGQRGHAGGLRLGSKALRTSVGDVVRAFEPDLDLVECFREDGSCPIVPVCTLADTLTRARKAFMDVLDATTVGSLTQNAPKLLRLLSRNAPAAAR